MGRSSSQDPKLVVGYLRWVNSQGQEQVYALDQEEILLGRQTNCDINFPNPYVSRQHARIVKTGRGYEIVDLQSTHGTRVNGALVDRHLLSHGDLIQLGREPAQLMFLLQQERQELQTWDEELERSLTRWTHLLPQPAPDSSELEKLSCILDFHYQFGRTFSPEKTFRQLLHSALRISGAERGFILLKQGDSFQQVAGMNGQGLILSEAEFHASRSVTREVLATGQPLFMTQGISGELAMQDSIRSLRLCAVACMPLTWISTRTESPEVQGILYLDSTQPMHGLSGLDQKILTKLAGEVANVFEKLAILKAVDEQRNVEKELALAREIQDALLPQQLPRPEGFYVSSYIHPTRFLGGDFYNFLDPGPETLTGVLADVSGKGISAALLSSLLQGALEMEYRSRRSLEQSLQAVNHFIYERTPPNRFVTLFLFTLDLQGEGQYLSAGHNPALIYRAPGGEMEELPSQGLILGAFDWASYRAARLRLASGDLLLIYTDGLTEAQSPEGEMFGEERLREILRCHAPGGAHHLNQQILQSLADFTRHRPQTDDITFLLIQKTQ